MQLQHLLDMLILPQVALELVRKLTCLEEVDGEKRSVKRNRLR
jgi:hypothetical protein